MRSTKPNQAAGISIAAFLVVAATSLAYYQFAYVPEANAKLILPKTVLIPKESIQIAIIKGAWQESGQRNFVPEEARGVIGLSNRVD